MGLSRNRERFNAHCMLFVNTAFTDIHRMAGAKNMAFSLPVKIRIIRERETERELLFLNAARRKLCMRFNYLCLFV